jgi:RIO kinase 1
MRIPDALASLSEYGIIEQVVRPLMSGKEAQVYLVRSAGEYRVAKVYKEAQNRTFKNRADYTEGRKVRNSRDQRAMGKNTRHGRAQIEAAWRSTEVDMIYRLRAAGVRVPTPYHFLDGVLVMEMIQDEHGEPAPRLGDVMLELGAATAVFDQLLAEVVRMLAAGVVHGDLSDFNVLLGPDGPVIIDFPQAVDASSNQNARKLLLRDVDNLHRYLARFAPERKAPPYAQEMWALYERGQLMPDTKLTGRHQVAESKVSTDAVLGLIGDAVRDERRRREQLGMSMRGTEAEEEGAPRPLSKYAQKREALVAARKLEAASNVAAPRAQRDGHGATGHDPRRQRAGEHGAEPRQAGAHAHPRQAVAHPRQAVAHPRQAGSHAQPHQAGSHPRQAGSHAQPQKAGAHPHKAHAQPQKAAAPAQPQKAAAHAQPRQAQPQRAAPHAQPRHAAPQPRHAAPQRPAHAQTGHAKPAHPPGSTNGVEAAPKRRRRRRKTNSAARSERGG